MTRLSVDAYRATFHPSSARPTRDAVIADLQAGRLRGFHRHGRWWVEDQQHTEPVTEDLLMAAWHGQASQA